MLNYRGYAQSMFSYNTSSLANASFDSTDVSSVKAGSFVDYKATKSGTDAAVTFKGYNLYLNSETSMRFYFKATDSITAKVNGETAEIHKDSNGFYVELTNITPANLAPGTVCTIQLGNMTIQASPASYAYTA